MSDGVTIIIGAAGAIGKSLTKIITEKHGENSVVAALRNTPLPDNLGACVISEFGVDVTKEETIEHLIKQYSGRIKMVWNLAAPLSVDTAKNVEVAHDTVVNGMERLLKSMARHGVKSICFSDSIGSYGFAAPRLNVSAKWLVENPQQDPGSEYGIQKRLCRNLLKQYAVNYGMDTRWCIIPGVLHADATWGGGTTEYALDAIKCAIEGREFLCGIPLEERLPMIYRDDLVVGLQLFSDAPLENLLEPDHGYTLAGFSFSPLELFAILREHFPRFTFRHVPNAQTLFARLWPDTLSGFEAKRDFGFEAKYDFRKTIETIIEGYRARGAIK